MDRQALATWWNEAWDEGLWTASWKRALDDLTAAKAAWKPDPRRHSIWQIVNHMIFWREDALARLRGSAAPSEAQVQELNFLEPPEADENLWKSTYLRFQNAQEQIALALSDAHTKLDRLQYLLPHDCYHFGQIMYIRALQGLNSLD